MKKHSLAWTLSGGFVCFVLAYAKYVSLSAAQPAISPAPTLTPSPSPTPAAFSFFAGPLVPLMLVAVSLALIAIVAGILFRRKS
jgi:hypothetical protein